MIAPNNKQTDSVCKFIANNGLPLHGEPDSFEAVVLHWVAKYRENKSMLHHSDIEIIKSHGLYDKIFDNDHSIQNELSQLRQQLADLLALARNNLSNLTPVVSDAIKPLSQITESNADKMRIALSFCSLPLYWEQKIIDFLKSNQDIQRSNLYKITNTHFTSKMIDMILNKLIYNKVIDVFYKNGSVKSILSYKLLKKDYVPNIISYNSKGNFHLNQWDMTVDNVSCVITIEKLRDFFGLTLIPENQESRIFANTWAIFKKYGNETYHPPIETESATPSLPETEAQAQPTISRKTFKRRFRSYIQTCNYEGAIWAEPYDGNFRREIPESDLIGKAVWRLNDGTEINYGIENYQIQTTGNVILYLRRSKSNGMYEYIGKKFANDSNLIRLIWKDPKYDFGSI